MAWARFCTPSSSRTMRTDKSATRTTSSAIFVRRSSETRIKSLSDCGTPSIMAPWVPSSNSMA